MRNKLLFILVTLLFSIPVLGVPNLPLSCSGPLAADGRCPETSYQYVGGKPGLRVATPSGVWELWENLSDTSPVRVCPADITPGTLCAVARVTVPRVQASLASGPAPTHPVRITWVPPTQAVDGTPLPAGEILGYTVSWRLPPNGVGTPIKVGNVTEYRFAAPPTEICFGVEVEGKSALSDSTPWVCVTPGARKLTPLPPSEVRVILE